jgi:predicted dehydrogenase
MSDVLRVGMVGYAFMGAAHAQAWRNANRFFDLPITPELIGVAGRSREAVSAAAERLGFASTDKCLVATRARLLLGADPR